MQRLISVAILSVTAFCLAGSAMAQQAPAAPGSGVPHGTRSQEIMQVKITVSDMDRSVKYYEDGIGLIRASTQRKLPTGTPIPSRPGFKEMPLNFTGSLAEAYFTLMQEAGHVPTPESAFMTVIGIKVKSVRDTLARLKAHGYPVSEVRDMGGDFRLAFVTDPDGYRIELIEAPSLAPSPKD